MSYISFSFENPIISFILNIYPSFSPTPVFFEASNVALQSVWADYFPPNAFHPFLLRVLFRRWRVKRNNQFALCVVQTEYPRWYATVNWITLISYTVTSAGSNHEKSSPQIWIAIKSNWSAFLQVQANCRQASQMHKQAPNNPVCAHGRWRMCVQTLPDADPPKKMTCGVLFSSTSDSKMLEGIWGDVYLLLKIPS